MLPTDVRKGWLELCPIPVTLKKSTVPPLEAMSTVAVPNRVKIRPPVSKVIAPPAIAGEKLKQVPDVALKEMARFRVGAAALPINFRLEEVKETPPA